MSDERDDIKILMSDVKTLIKEVSSVQTVNELQLVEMAAMKQSWAEAQEHCAARHRELEKDRAEKWQAVGERFAAMNGCAQGKETVWNSVWTKVGVIGTFGMLIIYIIWTAKGWGVP
ncbi:MAG: hypothetical protein P8182_15495 [Deltaproteobacteria bacterium]